MRNDGGWRKEASPLFCGRINPDSLIWLCCSLAKLLVSICDDGRAERAAERESKGESNHPDNASFAMAH